MIQKLLLLKSTLRLQKWNSLFMNTPSPYLVSKIIFEPFARIDGD